MFYLDTLPNFLLYAGLSLILCITFLKSYVWITPYNEFKDIDTGDQASSISVGGALIGFSLPLASLIAHSVNIVDLLIWSFVAFVIQLSIYFLLSVRFKEMAKKIHEGDKSIAWLVAMCSVAAGILNAACMKY